MRILVAAAGSRGDVQPLVALGLGLRAAGHQVTVSAASDFEELVTGHGLAFHGFPVSTAELLSSELGRDWLGHSSHSPVKEVRLFKQMVSTWGVRLAAEIVGLAGTSDLVVSGLISAHGADVLARAAGGRHAIALLAPFAPSRAGWAGLQAPLPRRSSVVNLVAAQVTAWVVADALRAPGEEVRRLLGQPRGSRREVRRVFRETPTLLGFSPVVVPPAPDWPATTVPTGYWILDQPTYRPDPALADFLAAGEPPVYLGFGSMSTHDAGGTTEVIVSAVERSGSRAVVHSGGAGLGAADLPDRVHVVGSVPHEWLLPRCAAAVHHGGAGTTAAALRAGIPSGVISHMGDQPYWGRRVHDLGVGAPPMRRHELTTDRLAGTLAALADPGVVARAAALGERLRAEDGVGRAVEAVARLLS